MKRAGKLGIVLASPVWLLAAALAFYTVTEYRPRAAEMLVNRGHPDKGLAPAGETLTLVTWNVGYFGLDAGTDFFLDGGKASRPRSRDAVLANLDGVLEHLAAERADVVLLQELDESASRTFGVDEVDAVARRLPGYGFWFAVNFANPFHLFPLQAPIGRVRSGLATLSRDRVSEAVRRQLPGRYAWPKRLFYAQRCAVVTELPIPSLSSSWLIINLHLTPFDPGGKQREQQLRLVRELATDAYARGRHVIVGGDWNSIPPGVAFDAFGPYTTSAENLAWLSSTPGSWAPHGWRWAYDAGTPTMRSLDAPYRPGKTFRTVVDAFLLSPNVALDSVATADLGFRNSDHNPVRLSIRTLAGPGAAP